MTVPYTGHPKTLDFSSMKDYEACPQRYKWSKIDKRKPVQPENSYYAICGIVKQKLFEEFYNQQWYKKGKDCVPFMEGLAASYFEETLKWAKVDFTDKIAKLTKEQLIEEVRDGVKKGIKIIKDHKLMTGAGGESKSEIKLIAKLDNKIDFLGKVDFILRHSNEKVWIMDGKDTAKPEKMKDVDPRQLWFYSLLYYQCYGVWPEKVGFLFWRHDTILEYDPKEGVEDVKKWIVETYWNVRNGKFEAKPSSSNCFFCKYKAECPDYARTVRDGGNTYDDNVKELSF